MKYLNPPFQNSQPFRNQFGASSEIATLNDKKIRIQSQFATGHVISGHDVNIVEGYQLVNFELTDSGSFRLTLKICHGLGMIYGLRCRTVP